MLFSRRLHTLSTPAIESHLHYGAHTSDCSMAEPSAEATAAHEIYRQTVMGDHLCDVLESFMEAGKLNEAMAHTVLRQFDLVSSHNACLSPVLACDDGASNVSLPSI